jgi:amidohydrolase
MASEAIVQLQTLVSRETNPFDPVVVTIGQIHGGSTHNVIAERCEVSGTIRSFNPEVDAFLKERVRGIAEGVAFASRGRAEVTFKGNIPVVMNDPACSHRMRDIVTKTLGGEYASEIALPTSGSEDFSFYLQKIPGAYFFHCGKFDLLPDSSEEAVNYPHHHPKFDVNESVLWTGVAALTAYALHWQD